MHDDPLNPPEHAQPAVDAVGFWWHSIDFGSGVVSPGFKSAELLAEELAALDLPELTGATVLDIGGWDGYFAFAAERRGAAAVTGLDHYVWSLDLPRQQAYWRECQAAGISPMAYETMDLWKPDTLPGKHGFDTARRLLRSGVQEIVADFANDDLSAHGQWDVVLFLGVLYHLHNPFDALKRLRALTRELAIIETHAIVVPGHEDSPMWRFYPGAELDADASNWWSPNLAGLKACLTAAGFGEVSVKTGPPTDGASDYRAVVHARVAPGAASGAGAPRRAAAVSGAPGGSRYDRPVPQPASLSASPRRRRDQPLLTRLINAGVLICPRCSVAGLGAFDGELRCENCQQRYPERNGIIDFLEYSLASAGRPIAAPPEVVDGVIRALGLSDTPELRATVADIYSRTFLRVPSPLLSAEISSFADRFGIEPPPTPRPGASDLVHKLERRLRLNRAVRARFDRHYIAGPLPAGELLHRNVRLTNVGRTPWASSGARALHLSYRWFTATGEVTELNPERTRFPIAIDPGRTISVPLRIRTPPQPGDYILRVALVRGTSEWLEDAQLSISVQVAPGAGPRLEAALRHSSESFEYAKDHEIAIDLLREYIRPQASERRLRVLEVGGGTSPQVGPLTEVDAVNIDIVAPLLELGAVLYGPESRDRLQFLCCDALEPPFAASSFDAVAMFATLHHFPEPEVLLSKCRELLTDAGFIAVLCEPVGDGLEHPAAVRDLLAGINEQVFSLEEYLALFDRAGLAVESGQLDGGSLKVILRPVGA